LLFLQTERGEAGETPSTISLPDKQGAGGGQLIKMVKKPFMIISISVPVWLILKRIFIACVTMTPKATIISSSAKLFPSINKTTKTYAGRSRSTSSLSLQEPARANRRDTVEDNSPEASGV
jgi:hypothetical protein